jgi:hypothetical protein
MGLVPSKKRLESTGFLGVSVSSLSLLCDGMVRRQPSANRESSSGAELAGNLIFY